MSNPISDILSTAYFTCSDMDKLVLDPFARLIKFKPSFLASIDP